MRLSKKGVAASVAVAIIAAVGVMSDLGGAVTAIREMTDVVIEELERAGTKPEEIGKAVVISTRLRGDTEGRSTEEVRIALERAAIPYRAVEEVLPEGRSTVDSEKRVQETIAQAQKIIDKHGGDVIIYGARGDGDEEIYLRGFVPEGAKICQCEHTASRMKTDEDGWEKKLYGMIELLVLTEMKRTQGGRALASDKTVEDRLKALEKKYAGIEKWKISEWGRGVAKVEKNQTRLVRAKWTNDDEYLQEVKETLENGGENVWHHGGGTEETRERLLAEVIMTKGLIVGDPGLLEKGMKIGLTTGAPKDAKAGSEWWRTREGSGPDLEMTTNLAIACHDKELIYRLLHMYLEIPGCTDSPMGQGCPIDAIRGLEALRYMRHVWVEGGQMANLDYLLNKSPMRYWYPKGHWKDPFTHASRLVKDEQRRRERCTGGYVTRHKTACAHVTQYVEEFGWAATPDEIPSYIPGKMADAWEEWYMGLGTGGEGQAAVNDCSSPVGQPH